MTKIKIEFVEKDKQLVRYRLNTSIHDMNRLFKSVISGLSSCLVLMPVAGASQLNPDDYLSTSDSDAMYGDWLRVGNDLHSSSDKVAGNGTEQERP